MIVRWPPEAHSSPALKASSSFANGSNINLCTLETNKSGCYCSEQWIAPCPHTREEGHLPPAIHSFVVRSLRALPITETELKLMAAAAIIG